MARLCSMDPSLMKDVPPEVRPKIELHIQRWRKIEPKMDKIMAERRIFYQRKCKEWKLERRIAEEQKIAEITAQLGELNTEKDEVKKEA
jgi:hypothetical protein